jgi:hypothetical protein
MTDMPSSRVYRGADMPVDWGKRRRILFHGPGGGHRLVADRALLARPVTATQAGVPA